MPRSFSLFLVLTACRSFLIDAFPTELQPVATADVTIIGAGVSGIATARELALEHNITDFLILDARSEPGGRAYTESLINPNTGHATTVEKGCNWVQGPNRDNITELVEKYNLRTAEQDYLNRTWFERQRGVDSSDVDVKPGKFVDVDSSIISKLYNDVSEKIMDFIQDRIDDDEVDLSARVGLSILGWRPKTALQKLYEWVNIDYTSAQPAEACSLYNFQPTLMHGDPDQLVVDHRGYKHIFVEELNSALDAGPSDSQRLFLNTTVHEIDWQSRSPRVHTNKGTFVARKHVVSTLSIGVLQDDRLKWTPSLPEWKKEAIFSFGMAFLQKTFLLFDRQFWGPEQFTFYADPEVTGRWPVWQNLNAVGFLNGSVDGHVLFNTHVDAEAHRISRMSDEDVKTEAMVKLREIYGPDIPEPLDILVPRWDLDPLFMGAYPNWPIGLLEEHHWNLKQPIGKHKQVLFTGDASSREMFGYVQGAWEEGKKTAAELAGCLSGGDCRLLSSMRAFRLASRLVQCWSNIIEASSNATAVASSENTT